MEGLPIAALCVPSYAARDSESPADINLLSPRLAAKNPASGISVHGVKRVDGIKKGFSATLQKLAEAEERAKECEVRGNKVDRLIWDAHEQ